MGLSNVELLATFSKDVGRIWNVNWHPEGDVLVSCGDDKSLRIWSKDGLTGSKWANKVVLTDGHKRSVRQVSWSPCGNNLASCSFDGTVCIWDKKSGEFECNAILEGHENEVKSCSWSKSGKYLATCSRDKSVWIWEIVEEDEYECAAVLNAHTQDVKKVIWHPQSSILASASYDNTIKIFQSDSDGDWICSATLQGHNSTVWSISFSADGQRIASCSDDETVKIWKEYLPSNTEGIQCTDGYPTWKCVCTLSGHHTRTVYDIAWCHLTGLIATACGDDTVRIFKEDSTSDPNAPNFNLIAQIDRAHTQDVNCVAWNPVTKGLLASCSDDGDIKIWKLKDIDS